MTSCAHAITNALMRVMIKSWCHCCDFAIVIAHLLVSWSVISSYRVTGLLHTIANPCFLIC